MDDLDDPEFVDELMHEDMPLWYAIFKRVPPMDGMVLFFEKDLEPFGWKSRGRVRTNHRTGWEVENVYSGALEFVYPDEVLAVEEGDSEPRG